MQGCGKRASQQPPSSRLYLFPPKRVDPDELLRKRSVAVSEGRTGQQQHQKRQQQQQHRTVKCRENKTHTHIMMHRRSRLAIDPRIPTVPPTEHVGFSPTRQALLAPSAKRLRPK